MGTISAEIVTQTWQAISQLTEKKTADLVTLMKDEQPLILGYLMALDDTPLTNTKEELSFTWGW